MSGSTNGSSGPDLTTEIAQPDSTTANSQTRNTRDPNYDDDLPNNLDPDPVRANNQMQGYDLVSRHLDGGSNLLHFRRFGPLNTRALLFMQWKLHQREIELSRLDAGESNESRSCRQRNDSFLLQGKDRETLMGEIVKELDEYNKYLINYGIIRGRRTSPADDLDTIFSWHGHYDGATHHGKRYSELGYLYQQIQRKDLVPLIPKEQSPLRSWFWKQEWLTKLPCWSYDPSTDDIKHRTLIEGRIYNKFIECIVYVLGLALILVPLWWLNYVEEREKRLAIISVFVAGFCFLLVIATPLNSFQNLGVAAAYAAVLLTFLKA